MNDLDAIRAAHVLRNYEADIEVCADDRDFWPCDTAIVLAALDETLEGLRAEVEAMPSPERHKDDANGNWFTVDMEYGWDCGTAAVLAIIDARLGR